MNLYDLSIGEDKMNQFLSIALKTHFESLKVSGKGENYWQCYQAFFNYCDIYGDYGTNNNGICIGFIHAKQVTRVILFHGVLLPTDT